MVSKKTAPAAEKLAAKAAREKVVAAKSAASRQVADAAPAVKAALPMKGAAKKAIIRAAFNENRNERGTDQFVRDLLREIGVTRPYEQDGGPRWKKKALAGGSKSAAGTGEGKPEFVFVSNGFIVVVEDKKAPHLTRRLENGEVVVTYPAREAYAFNGAVHYAATMLRNGVPHDKGIFAVGIGGDERHHEIAVAFLGPGQVKLLADLDNLDVFAEEAIAEYHSVAVLGNKPQAEARIDLVKEAASRLH